MGSRSLQLRDRAESSTWVGPSDSQLYGGRVKGEKISKDSHRVCSPGKGIKGVGIFFSLGSGERKERRWREWMKHASVGQRRGFPRMGTVTSSRENIESKQGLTGSKQGKGKPRKLSRWEI